MEDKGQGRWRSRQGHDVDGGVCGERGREGNNTSRRQKRMKGDEKGGGANTTRGGAALGQVVVRGGQGRGKEKRGGARAGLGGMWRVGGRKR